MTEPNVDDPSRLVARLTTALLVIAATGGTLAAFPFIQWVNRHTSRGDAATQMVPYERATFALLAVLLVLVVY